MGTQGLDSQKSDSDVGGEQFILLLFFAFYVSTRE